MDAPLLSPLSSLPSVSCQTPSAEQLPGSQYPLLGLRKDPLDVYKKVWTHKRPTQYGYPQNIIKWRRQAETNSHRDRRKDKGRVAAGTRAHARRASYLSSWTSSAFSSWTCIWVDCSALQILCRSPGQMPCQSGDSERSQSLINFAFLILAAAAAAVSISAFANQVAGSLFRTENASKHLLSNCPVTWFWMSWNARMRVGKLSPSLGRKLWERFSRASWAPRSSPPPLGSQSRAATFAPLRVVWHHPL